MGSTTLVVTLWGFDDKKQRGGGIDYEDLRGRRDAAYIG